MHFTELCGWCWNRWHSFVSVVFPRCLFLQSQHFLERTRPTLACFSFCYLGLLGRITSIFTSENPHTQLHCIFRSWKRLFWGYDKASSLVYKRTARSELCFGGWSRLRLPAQMALHFLKTFCWPSFQIVFLPFFCSPYDKNYLPEVCFSKNWPSVSQEDWVEYLHLKAQGKKVSTSRKDFCFLNPEFYNMCQHRGGFGIGIKDRWALNCFSSCICVLTKTQFPRQG